MWDYEFRIRASRPSPSLLLADTTYDVDRGCESRFVKCMYFDASYYAWKWGTKHSKYTMVSLTLTTWQLLQSSVALFQYAYKALIGDIMNYHETYTAQTSPSLQKGLRGGLNFNKYDRNASAQIDLKRASELAGFYYTPCQTPQELL